LGQTVGAEKWHTPRSREIINFETTCRSQNVFYTHITRTKQLCQKLQEQKSGILPDVVNESILKQTVGANTFFLPKYLDSPSLAQTVGAEKWHTP